MALNNWIILLVCSIQQGLSLCTLFFRRMVPAATGGSWHGDHQSTAPIPSDPRHGFDAAGCGHGRGPAPVARLGGQDQ